VKGRAVPATQITKPIRIGVIGCGEIAQVMHLPNIFALSEFDLTAVCDVSEELVISLSHRYAAQPYLDYREMLPHVDAVAVLTLDHAEIATVCAEAGKHLFVEKPLSFSPEGCKRIVAASKFSDVTLMVGYMKRFDPGYLYAIDLIGEMGRVEFIRVHDFGGTFSIHPPLYGVHYPTDISEAQRAAMRASVDAEMRAALGPGHAEYCDVYFEVLMSGSHDLTMLRGIAAPVSVAFSRALRKEGLLSVIECANGAICVFEIDLHQEYEWWDHEITVYGEDSTVTLTLPNPWIRHAQATVGVRKKLGEVPVTQLSGVSFESAFTQEWRHFARCVAERIEPISTGRDATADVEFAVEMVRAIGR
jgi:predicted dehydrogenase